MSDNGSGRRHSSIPLPVRTPSPGLGADLNMSNKRSSLPRPISPANFERAGSSRLSAGSSTDYNDTERRRSALPRPESAQLPQHPDIIQRKRRSQKPRSTGGFLLPDATLDKRPSSAAQIRDDRKRSRLLQESRQGKRVAAPPHRSTPSPTAALGFNMEVSDMDVDMDSSRLTTSELSSQPHDDGRRSQMGKRISRIPSPSPRAQTPAPLDMDSTQIVNMALNLSESRRLASRRNVSAPVPPRLAPVPDQPVVGSLKQHLTQQRRTSTRNISPRPDTANMPSPRHASVSSPRIGSTFPQSFEHEGSYTYHCSSSTLNRAQKVKEYFELMAQYRRLLMVVPPLEASQAQGQPLASPPATPDGSKQPMGWAGLQKQIPPGREYNPLQYIRNRKVRARERKAIDGEGQGFGDISRVTDWIDQVAVGTPLSGTSKLPYFPGAHDYANNPSNIPRPTSATGKPKRPRLDWSFDPADMLADVYWVEQDDNRALLENRRYEKLFPSAKVEKVQRPFSPQHAHEGNISAIVEAGNKEGRASLQMDNAGMKRVGTGESKGSARNRARQKLHEIKGSHKLSDTPHGYHDLFRLGRGAASDTSDSDNDRRRRDRAGTLTASGRDLLDKQMRDILAQEAAEKQNAIANESASDVPPSPGYISDPPSSEPASSVQGPSHNRSKSHIIENKATSKLERWPAWQPSLSGIGRASLDVPSHSKRSSVDHTWSQPTSPELHSSRRGSALIQASGSEMSPVSSRPGSPSRKPLAKVRNMFRDRSRERGERSEEKHEVKGRSSIEQIYEDLAFSPVNGDRRRSPSPAVLQKLPTRNTGESHKSHRSVGSLKLKGDEVSPFKTLLKGGAKLDNMVRGGVSKVTDLIWKKDSDDSDTSSSSSDDSDDGSKRGRRTKTKETKVLSRDNSRGREKHFLDVMPQFKSTTVTNDHRATPDPEKIPGTPPSGYLSPNNTSGGQRSSRFDKLKPPRLSVPNSPTAVSRISEEVIDTQPAEPGPEETKAVEDEQSRALSSVSEDPKRESSHDLEELLPYVPHALDTRKPRNKSMSLSKRDSGRHWSICDRDTTPRHSQLSKSELAGVRALILSSGVKAMEIARRANESHPLFAMDHKTPGVAWTDVATFVPDESAASLTASQLELYPLTSRVLANSIDTSIQSFHKSATQLTSSTVPELQAKIDNLHLRIATDLIKTTQETTDDADEVSRDLVHNQRLKVQHVVNAMEKMSRNRRRRFRWARRGLWLVVEWVLVASMWWLWAVFVVLRFAWLLGTGIWSGIRWLLWL